MKRTHKFGIELPKTVKEAFELDKKNGNTLWANAIAKEMGTSSTLTLQLQLLKKYGQSLDQNFALQKYKNSYIVCIYICMNSNI